MAVSDTFQGPAETAGSTGLKAKIQALSQAWTFPLFSLLLPHSAQCWFCLFAAEQGGSLPSTPSTSYKEWALGQTSSLRIRLSSQPQGEQGHTVLGACLAIKKVIVKNLAAPKPTFLHHQDWPWLSLHNHTLQIKNSKQPEQLLGSNSSPFI